MQGQLRSSVGAAAGLDRLRRNLERARFKRHDRVVINVAVGELKIAALEQLRLPGEPDVEAVDRHFARRFCAGRAAYLDLQLHWLAYHRFGIIQDGGHARRCRKRFAHGRQQARENDDGTKTEGVA